MGSAWIQTFSGRRFEPLAVDPGEICLADIAHALSNICRYTGHTQKFYSVAEHSVRVARYLLNAASGKGTALYGLLHDGSEAYLQDLPKPLKMLPEFAFYRAAEDHLQRLVFRRFGLSGAQPAEVSHADVVMLATERLELLGPPPESWGPLPDPIPGFQGFGWPPAEAEREFIAAFFVLGGVP